MFHRARPRRAAALVCLWAYVLGTLFGTAHLALVEHTLCADHGEVVHGAVACVASPEAHEAEADAPAPGARLALHDAAQSDHEHCASAYALRADLRFEPSPAAACDALPACASEPARAGLLRIQDDLFSLAPKQSPPA